MNNSTVDPLAQFRRKISDQGLTVMYVGREKTGKTHNAMTWPDPQVIMFDTNLMTLGKFDIEPIVPKTWDDFIYKILPAIQHHKLPAKTIVVDTISSAFDLCLASARAKGLTGFDMWGYVYDSFVSNMKLLIAAAAPSGKHTGYNIICTCHEVEIQDAKGTLLRIGLKLQGQSRNSIAPLFDTVLNTQCKIDKEFPPGGGTPSLKANFFVWTVPPDSYRTAGDGVGGGKYKTLPTKMPGDYPSLAKAWGLTNV